MYPKIPLTVNGQNQEIEADPEMPLLWALRDIMDIKGPKFGCGIAACGACTVLIDGEPVRSCSQPVGDVEGEITTIEGISEGDELHAVQQAWMKHSVPQCGYCQSGRSWLRLLCWKKTHPQPMKTSAMP